MSSWMSQEKHFTRVRFHKRRDLVERIGKNARPQPADHVAEKGVIAFAFKLAGLDHFLGHDLGRRRHGLQRTLDLFHRVSVVRVDEQRAHARV